MTDALAQWCLRHSDQGERPAASDPAAAFADWIERKREQDLRNDDVTLLVIDL
jgi:hypothetical protein